MGNGLRNVIQMFFRVFAICPPTILVLNNKSDKILYEAESPDEAAFVVSAKKLGFDDKNVSNISYVTIKFAHTETFYVKDRSH